jgi:hypothetical protein
VFVRIDVYVVVQNHSLQISAYYLKVGHGPFHKNPYSSSINIKPVTYVVRSEVLAAASIDHGGIKHL